MSETGEKPATVPSHEQVAAFRVGATLATQAIAVYIKVDQSQESHASLTEFDALPARLRVRVLEACAQEFSLWRDKLLKECKSAGDTTVSDLVVTRSE